MKTGQGDEVYSVRSVGGFSLRDYFAGCALTGLISKGSLGYDWDEKVKKAYDVSDLMLIERGNQEL